MDYLVYILIFLLVFYIFLILYSYLTYKRTLIRDRMDNIKNTAEPEYDKDDSDKSRIIQSSGKRGIGSILGKILPLDNYFAKKKRKLSQAYILMKPEEFLGISVLASLLSMFLLILLTKNLIVGVIGMFIGYIIPGLIVETVKKKRCRKLNNQLPEALDIISNGLKAGLSFTQAMSSATKELDSPISDEFKKVIRDNVLGKSMEDCLIDLSERTDDEDLDMFVTALVIQRQIGGNLSEILETISNTIRERVRLKGEVRTLTAQSRMSAYVIGLLPVGIGLMLFAINPNYIMILFTKPLGLALIGIVAIMEIIGLAVISKMVKLEV